MENSNIFGNWNIHTETSDEETPIVENNNTIDDTPNEEELDTGFTLNFDKFNSFVEDEEELKNPKESTEKPVERVIEQEVKENRAPSINAHPVIEPAKYIVNAHKENSMWVFTIPEIETTGQAKTREEIENEARGIIEAWDNIPKESIHIDLRIQEEKNVFTAKKYEGVPLPELTDEHKHAIARTKKVRKKEKEEIRERAEKGKKVQEKIKKATRKRKSRKEKESPVTEILVDKSGKPLEKLPKKLEEVLPEKKKKARLNEKEIEFFANLRIGIDKNDAYAQAGMLLGRTEDQRAEKERLLRIGQGLQGADALTKYGKRKLGKNDLRTIEFLAMFKYASSRTLALLCNVQTNSQEIRLKRLQEAGLVKYTEMYGIGKLWFITKLGMLISGYDLPRTTLGKITTTMITHQFVVNHTAAALWSGGINVLDEPGAPFHNRGGTIGENLISELQISSRFKKVSGMTKASYYREIMLNNIKKSFNTWEQSGKSSTSPEFHMGNEYMFALIPPASMRLNYHFPDLVIPRKRIKGEPESIAIEVELSDKTLESYVRTLTAYRKDTTFYKKVIWVVGGRGNPAKLEEAGKTAGVWENGRMEIIPILTDNGIFKGNLWEL